MEDFWFYIKLGFNHVMDTGAYDHILFLCALALPFTLKDYKKVIVLATIFTVAHCLSLALSVYGILEVNAVYIEFLIPITIVFTAIFNIASTIRNSTSPSWYLHILVTAFFGLVHGFGFSNYFNMLMAEEDNKLGPLLGFATGIELSQLLIILMVLLITSFASKIPGVKESYLTVLGSIIITVITIPILFKTFPW